MAKTSKTSDKRSKKSGEMSEEKLDKVAGGHIDYTKTALASTQLDIKASLYDTSIKVPTVPTKPILKP